MPHNDKMPQPTLFGFTTRHENGFLYVTPKWSAPGIDLTGSTFGEIILEDTPENEALAERFTDAVVCGRAYTNVEIVRDADDYHVEGTYALHHPKGLDIALDEIGF